MKINVSILVIAMLLALAIKPNTVFSQGNLQFNQVLLVSSSQTVPAGKVWKVESALQNSTLAPPASQSHMNANYSAILVAGNTIVISSTFAGWGTPAVTWSTGPGMGAMDQLTHFPFWLPAGVSLAASTAVTYLSVVEFNIIP